MQPCIIENTTYVSDLHIGDLNGDGEATYIMNVIKHNCRSPVLLYLEGTEGRAAPFTLTV
jgi:hypothetical protein